MKRKKLSLSSSTLIELIRAVYEKDAAFRFPATGFSMHPTIKDDDRILIEPLSGVKPDTGHIVAFIHPDNKKLVVHRVVGKKGNAYLLKGDNSADDDGYVPESNILGLVRAIERRPWWKRAPFRIIRVARSLLRPFEAK